MSAISNPRPTPTTVPTPVQPRVPEPPAKGKPWKWLVLLALLGGGGYAAYHLLLKPPQAAPGQASTAAAVKTAKVTVGTLEVTARIAGQTASREFFNITAPIVRSPDSGREMILLFLIQSGARVKKGDLLAQIDAKSVEDHIDDIGDDIERAESDIRKRKAEQDVDRENLQQTIRVARAEFDKATLEARATEVRTVIDQELLKLAAEEAEANYVRSQADVKQKLISHAAEIKILEITKIRHERHRGRHLDDVKKMIIKSPMDGLAVVQQTFRGGDWNLVQQGDQLQPGQLFMKVVNPAKMQVEASINQTESSQFRLGQKTTIRLDAFPGMQFPGSMFSIGALASGGFRQSFYIRNVPVKISINASHDRLIPDLSASVDVRLAQIQNAKLLPLAALQQENGKDVVYVKRGTNWDRREIKLGQSNSTHAAVESGLEAGDEVALEKPQQLLARM